MRPSASGETSLNVMDFVEYLGIELELEPEMTWVRGRNLVWEELEPEMTWVRGEINLREGFRTN
jgi:hypothetical protein